MRTTAFDQGGSISTSPPQGNMQVTALLKALKGQFDHRLITAGESKAAASA